jgi:hypothetical protein
MQMNQAKDLKDLLQRLELPQYIGPPTVTDICTHTIDIKDPADKMGMGLMEVPYTMYLAKFSKTAINMCRQDDESVCQVRLNFNTKEIGNFSITTHFNNHKRSVSFTNNYNKNVSDEYRAPGYGLVGDESSEQGFTIEITNWFYRNYEHNVAQYKKRLNEK